MRRRAVPPAAQWLALFVVAAAADVAAASRGAPMQPSAMSAGSAKVAAAPLPGVPSTAPSHGLSQVQHNDTVVASRLAVAPSEEHLDQVTAAGPTEADWESSFASGLQLSKSLIDGPEPSAFVCDSGRSDAAVPSEMIRAEVLLEEGASTAPSTKQREKKAELALRMYYHAKWLAERNYERASEWRYHEAARVAREAKRSVLAAHSMSRLGYYLMHWARLDEAREVLRESERLNTKSNPLGPFLYGVLERRTAGGDMERLRAAETRILEAGQQPSEELEAQRVELCRQIRFWRAAELSAEHCWDGADVAEVLLCLAAHAVSYLSATLLR